MKFGSVIQEIYDQGFDPPEMPFISPARNANYFRNANHFSCQKCVSFHSICHPFRLPVMPIASKPVPTISPERYANNFTCQICISSHRQYMPVISPAIYSNHFISSANYFTRQISQSFHQADNPIISPAIISPVRNEEVRRRVGIERELASRADQRVL